MPAPNQLEHPTLETIRRANDDFFNPSGNARIVDDTVRLLFTQWSHNTDRAHVLAKVVLLNRLFSTNIYDVYTVADYIVDLEIDPRLAAGDIDLVEDIANVPFKPKPRRLYSFATKYCARHNPDAYQVYDARVDTALWRYGQQTGFADFKRAELWTFPNFMRIIEAFRIRFKVQSASRPDLDRFLWTVGGCASAP